MKEFRLDTDLVENNDEMFTAITELGQAKIRVDILKHKHDTIVEQNRALKSVISNG